MRGVESRNTLQERSGSITTANFVKIISDLGLLVVSAFLFSFSFPSGLSEWGLFPLAFFAQAPLFYVLRRCGWRSVFPYGFFYGFLSYFIFNFWLIKFHPLAIFIVPVIYAFYFLILFPILKFAGSVSHNYGYIIQAIVWICYEFVKTTGFLGYPYGILGYSQYLFSPLARIAAVAGVWGVSLIVIFPSSLLGNAFASSKGDIRAFFIRNRRAIGIYFIIFLFAISYGIAAKKDLSGSPTARVGLVQHNVDPWKHDYKRSLDILLDLSRKALAYDPDIVVWSETAFVPAIDYHTKYRKNRDAYELVKRLKDFLTEQKTPFVLGNDDGQLKSIGGDERIDYNAALLFDDGDFKQIYRKIKLVPFTEHFPFEKQLPGIYKMLKDADTHFWEKGNEYSVFEAAGIKFSTPICFEDTFGNISREFIRNGAEIIINITNDSWSNSIPSEMQHMGMALFRAIENRRTIIRATNGGITCAIDPNGRITAMLQPFTQDILVTDIPIYTNSKTLYTIWGDWFPKIGFLVAAVWIIFCLALKSRKNGK